MGPVQQSAIDPFLAARKLTNYWGYNTLAFFAPDILVEQFPAWDCLPYDRVSPHAAIVAQRMIALSRLARTTGRDRPAVLLTTVNAALQRVPARKLVAAQALSAAPGNMLPMQGAVAWLELNGAEPRQSLRPLVPW